MIVHILVMCTGDAGPEQSLVLLNLIFLVKFTQFNTNFFVIHSSFSTLLPCAEMASAFVLNLIYLMKFNWLNINYFV